MAMRWHTVDVLLEFLDMKINRVSLTGALYAPPRIRIEDGKKTYAVCCLQTVNAKRDNGLNKHMEVEMPRIITRVEKMIDKVMDFTTNDIIDVEGVVSTKKINKGANCPHCGYKNKRKGLMLLVYPIEISKQKHLNSDEEVMEYLKEKRESSCRLSIGGMLTNEPARKEAKGRSKGLVFTQYQLAVERQYHIREDPADEVTDFPWVKSYGKQGESDYKYLRKGSTVIVDGMLKTRDVNHRTTCDDCGQEFTWRENVTEIVPYRVEYIANYNPEEEADERWRRWTSAHGEPETMEEHIKAVLSE